MSLTRSEMEKTVAENSSTRKVDQNSIIKLNVGGYKCEFTKSLFQVYPDSFLAKMFSEENVDLLPQTDEAGYYFINRDQRVFPFILQLYLNRKMSAVKSGCIDNDDGIFGVCSFPLDAFSRELAFFGLPLDLLNWSHNEELAAMQIKQKFETEFLRIDQCDREFIRDFTCCVRDAIITVAELYGSTFLTNPEVELTFKYYEKHSCLLRTVIAVVSSSPPVMVVTKSFQPFVDSSLKMKKLHCMLQLKCNLSIMSEDLQCLLQNNSLFVDSTCDDVMVICSIKGRRS